MLRKLAITIFILLFDCSLASAANLYVDAATGDDSYTRAEIIAGAGTLKWDTLGRALWGSSDRSTPDAGEAATAGDTVYVTAGTYTAPDTASWSAIAFQPVNEGTSESARIIIQAVGTVNLSSTGTSGGPIIGSNGKDYITWDGFTIDEGSYTSLDSGEQANVMFCNGANYGTVKNCTLIGMDNNQEDANHGNIFFHGVSNGYAYNNTISGTRATGTNCAGIYTYAVTDTIIEHNEVYDCDGGIFIKGLTQDSVTVRFNKVHDIAGVGIRMSGTSATNFNTNIHVYQNVLWGITYSALMSSSAVRDPGNIFANNTIYNVGAYGGGLLVNGLDGTTVQWYNNIVHTAAVSAIYTENYSNPTPEDDDFEHNVYYGIPSGQHFSLDGGGFQTWTTWTTTWAQDGTDPDGTNGTDPLFANIAGNDFRLCTASGAPHASCTGASPALTVGRTITAIHGSNGETIPAGAYITGNETIGIESESSSSSSAHGMTIVGGAHNVAVGGGNKTLTVCP